MIARVEMPASFLCRAHQYLRRTGRPFVYAPRRRTDIGLSAEKNRASQRWAFVIDVGTLPEPIQEALLAHVDPVNRPTTELMMRLSKYARIAVEGLPGVFEHRGCVIGRLDVCDGLPVVSNAMTLSCLSYVLRHYDPRTGFFVRLLG